MKKRFKSIKRVVSFLLALLITVSSITVSSIETVNAETSATERVENFISLAAGKQSQDLDSALSLTKDELRFLGVYLSNFYIPFGTELGTTNSDTIESEKTSMIEALANGLNFNQDLSETLVETIIGLSRSNYQTLEFRVSKSWHKGYTSVPEFDLNYFTFLTLMMGNDVNISYVFGADVYKDFFEGAGYKYGYFGYEKEGTFYPMFDCGIDGETITPSMIAFDQCLNSIDWENGYGLNFFDFNPDEQKSLEDIYGAIGDMSNDAVYKMSAYGAKMIVDCFGNIIVMGGCHQYVVVPGCMNPYTWVSVDSSGEDIMQAGNYYNVITFQGMSLADTGKLVTGSGSTNSASPDKNALWFEFQATDSLNSKMSNNKEKSIKMGPAEYVEGTPMRVTRGTSDYTMDNSLWWGGDGVDLLKKAEQGAIYSGAGPWYWGGAEGGLNNPPMPGTDKEINDYILLPVAINNASATKSSVKVLNNMVYVDNLGAFGFDDSDSEINYNVINFDNYLESDGSNPNQLFSAWGQDAANGFTNLYSNIESGKINSTVTAEDYAIVSVYTTYAIAGLYENTTEAKKATIGKLGYRINTDGLVSISADPISIPSSIADSIVNNSIRNWIYYLLHPTKGFDYVRILITNKVNALLVGWHNSMVGTQGVGAITGTTYYRNNIGYVTTPDLSEIEWTSKLIDLYNNAIPFLIVIMIITMLFAYITSIMSIQRCVFGVVIFSCFLLLPVNCINGIVSASNRITQNIYGEKFTYWALVQQESYASQLDEAASGESYSNYLKYLYATNNEVYSNQGSDSIVLKWQAPKKMASLMLSSSDSSILDSLSSSKLIGYALNRDTFSGETYLDGESTYLYRSYTDIGNFSRFVYNGLDIGTQASRSTIPSDVISNVSDNTKSAINSMSANYSNDRLNGYTNYNGDGSTSTSGELRTIKPLTSKIYNDALAKKGIVKNMGINDFVGINQDVFNFSVAMFNNSGENYKDNLLENCSDVSKDDLQAFLNNYTDEDLSGLAAYSLMSESPFYYFSWDLYDTGMSTSASATNGYKSLLLGKDDGGFFYNVDGNGELKDFMDMKSLFTYVIPYLREGNDLVREWDEIYGTEIYDGVPTEEGHWNDTDIKNSKELQQKYWHNLNVARLYEIYTPWVDLMYDCSYAQPETISVLGERVTIQDPLNPASYPDERPMIFSESEMLDYGLSESDLTKVEKLILDFNKGAESRMYELLNYYNFSDITLNTAAAINCTFEFNITFSENGIFSDNINLYPQSFEIADFSYDAFLRFILANTVGIDMTSQDDFYMTIVQNSSMTTAIVMIVLDILSQYVLPAFKLFFLILVFISVILLILVTAFKVDPEQKFIGNLTKGIFVPMLSFFAITIGFAWVVSLFMGVGNNAVTETKTTSISMGDPVTVMLALGALDVVVIIVYYKILKGIVKDIKHNFKAVTNFMGGVFGSALVSLGGIMHGIKGITSRHSGGSSGGSVSRGDSVSENGTGRESERATRRANENTAQGMNDNLYNESNERVNDTKRKTMSEQKDSLHDEKKEKEKKDILNSKTKSGMSKMSYGAGESKEKPRSNTANKVKDSGKNK